MSLLEKRKTASLLSKGDSSSEIKLEVLQRVTRLGLAPAGVLDVGCGTGEFLGELQKLFPKAQLFGSDITHFNPSGSYKFIELDLNHDFHEKLPKFDLITTLEVIEHLENPRHFIRQISLCLNPGGHLVLSTPNPESLTSILSFMVRGHHSAFGGKAYPAHITPVPLYDLKNIALESERLEFLDVHFIPNGRLPKCNLLYRNLLPFVSGKRFSDNYLAIFKQR